MDKKFVAVQFLVLVFLGGIYPIFDPWNVNQPLFLVAFEPFESRVPLAVNICPFDARHKLSPTGGGELKKIAAFALSPQGSDIP